MYYGAVMSPRPESKMPPRSQEIRVPPCSCLGVWGLGIWGQGFFVALCIRLAGEGLVAKSSKKRFRIAETELELPEC